MKRKQNKTKRLFLAFLSPQLNKNSTVQLGWGLGRGAAPGTHADGAGGMVDCLQRGAGKENHKVWIQPQKAPVVWSMRSVITHSTTPKGSEREVGTSAVVFFFHNSSGERMSLHLWYPALQPKPPWNVYLVGEDLRVLRYHQSSLCCDFELCCCNI